jgi:RimJ/RimL family protein N-acetyltransferase
MDAVTLVPWAEDDLVTLQRNNAPEMMTFLGGPESDEAVVARHERYLRLGRDGTAHMYRIVTSDHPEGVGVIGYWEHVWKGEASLETGWSVETAHQGRGIGTAALRALLAAAAEERPGMAVYAFPRVDNTASNAICAKAGMRLLGEADFEYPKGNPIVSNVWVA